MLSVGIDKVYRFRNQSTIVLNMMRAKIGVKVQSSALLWIQGKAPEMTTFIRRNSLWPNTKTLETYQSVIDCISDESALSITDMRRLHLIYKDSYGRSP